MQRFRLANLLLEADDFLRDDTDLLYRLDGGGSASYDGASGEFSFSGSVDFCTYFNAVSTSKWRRYAHLVSIRLHVEVAGDACTLTTRGFTMPSDDGPVTPLDGATVEFDQSGDFKVREVDMPMCDTVVSGFSMDTAGTVRVRNAYYYTLVDAAQIRPVRLALCTTTFHKEDYIIANIARIRSGIIESGEPVSDGFYLYVVDNGQTLDAGALSGGGVTVIPNCNAGGAGGFARGMMAALEEEGADYTHVVLMDDDVRMSVESLKRLFALLSLADAEYSRAFVNGAMLQLEDPSLQFEDVSRVRPTGGFEKLKPDLRMDGKRGIIRNEMMDVEVEGAYGAWWFSCMPVSYIREMGLPMPFFVRCDDVEYGLRCKPVYMTMNGICVWHARFEGRFNAAVACYQYIRNMLVTMALHRCGSEFAFMLRYWRLFHIYLRTMDYAAAELWLDGLEDYLKGPEFLMGGDPFAAMSRALSKAERLVPLEELDQDVVSQLEVNLGWLSGDYSGHTLRKLLVSIPHDRHWFPDALLSSKPAIISPSVSENFVPWTKTAMRKCLVAMSPDGKRGAIRTIDRARHAQLAARYRDLMWRYRNSKIAVAELYRERTREMSSPRFWKRYLGMG